MRVAIICPRCKKFSKGDRCLHCSAGGNEPSFYTSKDKLWDFVDVNSTGKPIEIRSKGQWKRHLKKNGLHDDVPKYHKTGVSYPKVSFPREEVKGMIREEMKDRGIYDSKKLFKKVR